MCVFPHHSLYIYICICSSLVKSSVPTALLPFERASAYSLTRLERSRTPLKDLERVLETDVWLLVTKGCGPNCVSSCCVLFHTPPTICSQAIPACVLLFALNSVPIPSTASLLSWTVLRCGVMCWKPAKEMVAKIRESQEIAHKSRVALWRYGDCCSDDEDDF